MKNFLTLSVLVLILCSCSSDDDTNSDNATTSYYSLEIGDQWSYDVRVDDNASSTDNLEITSEQTIQNNTYSTFTASPESSGFMTRLLENGALRETNGKLFYTGIIDVQSILGVDFDIPVEDVIIYDVNASDGGVLSEVNEEVTQTVNGVPVTFELMLQTTQGPSLTNTTIGGLSFENTLQSSFLVTARAFTSFLGAEIPIIERQDILFSSNIYGENIGLLQSSSSFMTNFEDLSDLGINAPLTDIDFTVTQTITDYTVASD